ncbi:hypothetical protein RCL1_003177 [Eukaryota sp. TZLM3-RCL]
MDVSVTIHLYGAAMEVGRSCFAISWKSQSDERIVILDCGVHMGNPNHRYPIIKDLSVSKVVAIIVSHFHLDHLGAIAVVANRIPSVPIYMTYPTKAISPLILEDLAKHIQRGSTAVPTASIDDVLRRTKPISFRQNVILSDVQFSLYPAGHVIGASMILVQCYGVSLYYTGDFTPIPERHLSRAVPPHLPLDILLSEATSMLTPRFNTTSRDLDFLSLLHNTVQNGGRVLVPTTGLGRMQELCVTVDSYWFSNNIEFPVYYATGLSAHADVAYNHFKSWTSNDASFNYKKIKRFEWTTYSDTLPCVVFAAPAMLQAGISLELFKRMASDHRNVVVLPSYTVNDTLAHSLANNTVSSLEVDGVNVPVKCKIEKMEFSAHSDGLGLCKLLKLLNPKHLVFVHCERKRMEQLKNHLKGGNFTSQSLQIHTPAAGESVVVNFPRKTIVDFDRLIFTNPASQTSFSLPLRHKYLSENFIRHGYVHHSPDGTKFLDKNTGENLQLTKNFAKIEQQISFTPTVPSEKLDQILSSLKLSLNNLFNCSDDDLLEEGVIWTNNKEESSSCLLKFDSNNSVLLCWGFEVDYIITSVISLVKGVLCCSELVNRPENSAPVLPSVSLNFPQLLPL